MQRENMQPQAAGKRKTAQQGFGRFVSSDLVQRARNVGSVDAS